MTKKKKWILIVEDERALSSALKHKLTQAGYEVTIAEDGEEALKHVRKRQFDLILLDILLPKVDGYMFLEELRKRPTVMVLSNLSGEREVERAKELGVVEYLIKSDNPMAKILKRVETILENRE